MPFLPPNKQRQSTFILFIFIIFYFLSNKTKSGQ